MPLKITRDLCRIVDCLSEVTKAPKNLGQNMRFFASPSPPQADQGYGSLRMTCSVIATFPRVSTLILLAFTFYPCFPVTGADLDVLFLDPRDASCTDRCHVNSLSYRNDFEGEVFQHLTHSSIGSWVLDSYPLTRPSVSGLHCVDCHEDREVNTEGHGRLIISKEDCLSCHHVDNKEEKCARCHKGIDARPMEYQGKPFVHGFTVDSSFNCRECHLADPKSSMKEEINCNKCHHTRPRIDCRGCHEESLKRVYYPRPVEINHLGWTAEFRHSQHPETAFSCQECHPPREDRVKGVGEYQAHCGQCHHKEKADCQRCHQQVFQFFNGNPLINGVSSIPDKMSRALRCEDCHKPLKEGGGFSEVGEECARCHNKHYAELLEAQKGVILSWLDRLRGDIALSSLRQEGCNDPGLSDGKSLEENIHDRFYGEEKVSDPSNFPLNEGLGQSTGLLNFVEHYGLHNFLYSRRILSFLEKGSQPARQASLP